MEIVVTNPRYAEHLLLSVALWSWSLFVTVEPDFIRGVILSLYHQITILDSRHHTGATVLSWSNFFCFVRKRKHVLGNPPHTFGAIKYLLSHLKLVDTCSICVSM